MLSGVKIIPRDQVQDEERNKSDSRWKEEGSRKKKWYSSDEDSSFSTSESEREDKKRRRKGKNKKDKSSRNMNIFSDEDELDEIKKGSRKKKRYSSDENSSFYRSKKDIARKEMGLDWMLRSESKRPAVSETNEMLPEEAPVEESKKANPRELNPYLKDDGSGYPEESDGVNVAASKLLSSSLVGDGGASWRLKALKRAQEQAAREGRSFQEGRGRTILNC